MKIFLWSLLALFLIGDAFFVLPYHFSSDSITTTYDVNYKRDSLLLKNVFTDSSVIQLRMNMPPLYEAIGKDAGVQKKPNQASYMLVNVAVLHNLDFTALVFPFYKVTAFNSAISFFSIIKASNAPDRDSTALVGNIIINGKLTIKGICSPVYAKGLVEKKLARILAKEMDKIETDINRRPVVDTSVQTIAPVTAPAKINTEKTKKK